MERNRVLWVIFSISLFLVVVLAGGLYLLRPVAAPEPEVTAGQSPPARSFDVFEYVRGRSELPEPAEEADAAEQMEEMVIIVGEREDQISGEGQSPSEPAEKTVSPKPGEEPAASAPGAHTAAGESSSAPGEPTPGAATPAAAVAAQRSAPTARPRTQRTAPAATASRPAPQPREVAVTEYWIQAGSYSSPSRAQEVAEVLEDQGLISKITTRNLSGTTYYRVRIGPYMNRAEAEKFLGWIKAVQGFESSYISMVRAKRRTP